METSKVSDEDIFKYVSEFKNALEFWIKNDNSFNNSRRESYIKSNYPRGCCQIVSDLLGLYLVSKGVEIFEVYAKDRKGDRDNDDTHTWLETKDGLIIDITIKQYSCFDGIEFYFGYDNEFYTSFSVREKCHITRYDLSSDEYNYDSKEMMNIYNIIVEIIRGNQNE